MPDIQIKATGVVDTPEDYKVPGTASILLKQIHAEYVDNGASGDWLPEVQFISDAGVVLGRASDQGVVVTAGNDASVTWFPGVKHASAASGGLNPDWGTYTVDSSVVHSGATGSGAWTFSTGTALLGFTTPTAPYFKAQGVYAVVSWVQSDDAWNTTALAGARLSFGGPTSFETRQTGGVDSSGSMKNFSIYLTAEVAAHGLLDLSFENFDTVDRNMYSNQVLVQLIGTY